MMPVIAVVGDRRAESSVTVMTAFPFSSSPVKEKKTLHWLRDIYIINLYLILTMMMETDQVSKGWLLPLL
jgi:hypothetical protein